MMGAAPELPLRRRRVFLLGATGTIGRAALRALLARGWEVVCFGRDRAAAGAPGAAGQPEGARLRSGNVHSLESLLQDGLRGESFDAVLSCMASRTGMPADAWAIDHDAHLQVLAAARAAGIAHFVLLSAICVQKPLLAFQHAKLAFERALIASGIDYTIVRPTAFFKSLSGQVERVRRGRPFLVFGDGTLSACKPIGDDDLGAYLADCLDDRSRRGCVLPIGGPGAPITPREQGERLFALLGRTPRFRHVPLGLLDGIIGVLDLAGRLVPAARDKAQLARIGRYYASESMLVLDPYTGRYDAAATPSTGTQTLFDYYEQLLSGAATAERGAHAVFQS